jgi:uncharacterized repeat protein (TIGR01451 family)
MRLSATTATWRLAPALLAAIALSLVGPGAALAAKPSHSGGTSPDTTPPTVSIASPAGGSTVSASITVSGSAADNVSVASVQVSVDNGSYQPASGTTSWSYAASSLGSGAHTITAKATDTAGNTATASVSVSVSTVSNATPPTSSITAPRYNGAVVSGTYALTGSSNPGTYGVAREQWAIDGTTVATGTSSTGLTYNWDTTQVTQASHSLTYTSWDTAGNSSSVTRPITVGTATVKRVAVILYQFDNQAPPMSAQQVADWTFGSTRSVGGYYQEETYGRLLLGGQNSAAGDVFGFYTIPYAYPTTATCDFTNWEGSALNQATAAGVNLSGYDVVMLTAAVPPGCGSGTGGGTQDRVPWNNPASVDQWIAFAAHELGHSFGIHHHASSDTCTDSTGHTVQVSTTCSSAEYGDPYDIMGSGQVQDMNMYEKGQIGVLRTGNALTVTTSGTYTMAPSTAPSSGVQSIRIPHSWDASGSPLDYYYLEFRQPAAYDVLPSGVVDYDGVQIRQAPDYSAAATVSKLIDATPGSITALGSYDNWDGRLPAGEYFQDTTIGLTVQAVSTGSQGATLKITMGTPQCIRVNPTVSVSPAQQQGAPGQALSYTVTLVDNDSPVCGASNLTVNASLPAGLTQSPASTTVSGIYPAGATTSWQVTVTASPSTTAGTYAFSETAVNGSSGGTATATASETVS